MTNPFETCAEDYDAFRPGYPDELFDFLAERFALRPGAIVADVGAGTGRATGPLADRGYEVLAVEPSEAMRARAAPLVSRYGGRVRLIDGSAEATGLPAQSADLLVCAQAFHWFDPARALPEFSRVVRAGGGLAVFWNDRDLSSATIARELEGYIRQVNPSYRCEYRERPWAQIIADEGSFRPVETRVFRHSVEMTEDSLLGLTRSFSYVRNVLDAPGRAAFEEQVRALVRRLHADRPFRLVYRSELYVAQRRSGQAGSPELPRRDALW